MTFTPCSELESYFQQRLVSALQRRGLRPQASTEHYLLSMLSDYGMGEQRARELGRPLGPWFFEAIQCADVPRRFRELRRVGDTALYSRGFFSEYLSRRGISNRYVAEIGERAYAGAHSLVRHPLQTSSPKHNAAYRELASGFEEFAAVLDEVKEATSLRTPQEIVRLYDRWRRTGSSVLAERLRSAGVFPQRVGSNGDN